MADQVIIGIGGHIGSGKDTAAEYLCREYGFSRIGFADALKREVQGHLRRSMHAYLLRVYGQASYVVERDLLWKNRDGFTRALLQDWGSFRRKEDPDYWVKRWERSIAVHSLVVTPDVRVHNEIEAVKRHGGHLILITRTGKHGDGHETELLADDLSVWDKIIQNDGAPQELWAYLSHWLHAVVQLPGPYSRTPKACERCGGPFGSPGEASNPLRLNGKWEYVCSGCVSQWLDGKALDGEINKCA